MQYISLVTLPHLRQNCRFSSTAHVFSYSLSNWLTYL